MELLVLVLGTLFGFIVGLVPGIGATTGLVMLFPALALFGDPYLGVIFIMAVVASSTTGDSYTGVLLGIPGANSAAATMVDGFPLAKQGKATLAISSAVTCSTINGLLWGCLVFFFLPWYSQLILVFGIPELWAFTMLALATVTFVSSKYWLRSSIALGLGIYLGLVGVDPTTNVDRFTFGWGYLADSIQLMPMVAGLFAIPEIIAGFQKRESTSIKVGQDGQTKQGILEVWKHRWLALRGGFIGAFIGALPGLGGAMGDWMAYGLAQTTTKNPDPPFGKGNIRGVIGPEGANNAQKATSMLPTVLFGIPGASFAAVVLALFAFLDFELGTLDLVADTKFFNSMTYGFLGATILVAILCFTLTKHIAKISMVPYKYYFPFLIILITWACMQYTGGWEDFVILLLCSGLGYICKEYKFSRPALLIGFILADKVEALTIQIVSIYNIETLVNKPIFCVLILLIIVVFIYGLLKKEKLDYA